MHTKAHEKKGLCVYTYSLNALISLVIFVQAWFLDQFGVLHDGKQPYPGAISTCMFSSVSLAFGKLGLVDFISCLI